MSAETRVSRCAACGEPKRKDCIDGDFNGRECPGAVARKAAFYEGKPYSHEDVERWTEGLEENP